MRPHKGKCSRCVSPRRTLTQGNYSRRRSPRCALTSEILLKGNANRTQEKIVQTRAMKVYFLIAECSLSYVKLALIAEVQPSLCKRVRLGDPHLLWLANLALKAQKQSARGSAPGINAFSNCALKGQKHPCANAFALSGRYVFGIVYPGCRLSANAPRLCPGLCAGCPCRASMGASRRSAPTTVCPVCPLREKCCKQE